MTERAFLSGFFSDAPGERRHRTKAVSMGRVRSQVRQLARIVRQAAEFIEIEPIPDKLPRLIPDNPLAVPGDRSVLLGAARLEVSGSGLGIAQRGRERPGIGIAKRREPEQ